MQNAGASRAAQKTGIPVPRLALDVRGPVPPRLPPAIKRLSFSFWVGIAAVIARPPGLAEHGHAYNAAVRYRPKADGQKNQHNRLGRGPAEVLGERDSVIWMLLRRLLNRAVLRRHSRFPVGDHSARRGQSGKFCFRDNDVAHRAPCRQKFQLPVHMMHGHGREPFERALRAMVPPFGVTLPVDGRSEGARA